MAKQERLTVLITASAQRVRRLKSLKAPDTLLDNELALLIRRCAMLSNELTERDAVQEIFPTATEFIAED